MAQEIEIQTGLAIATPTPADRTTPQGFRRVLGALLRQSAPGEPVRGVLGVDHLVVSGRSNMGYNISAGYAVTGRATQGAYICGIVTGVTIDTPAANGTNPRIDRIYIVQPDPELSDSGKARIGVAVGTPAATPTAPTIPTGALELARKVIAAGAVNTTSGAAFTNVPGVTGTNAPPITPENFNGVLPVNKGGTGAATPAAARTALGITAANIGARDGSWVPSWGDVTGKPSTFAPSSHSHAAGDVSSGVLALARIPNIPWGNVSGKPSTFAPSSHTHTWGQITGKPSIPSDQGSNVQTLQAGGFSRLVWDRNITSSRRAAWIADGSNILLGHTDSSERFKDNITTDTGIDPLAVLEIDVVLYQWIVELRKRDDPSFEGYVGPHHKVAVEVGMIAERLHEAGLWQFVYYEHEDDGSLRLVEGEPIPRGIHYELWAMAVLVATQHVWAEHRKLRAEHETLRDRIAQIEERIA